MSAYRPSARTQSPAEYVGRADAPSMAYLDFLNLVLEEELAVRESAAFGMLVLVAGG
ncbi:hypothetical protein ABZ137_03825 [Streptomyces bobili]|uniref:hypothetical protein n=1 Tax=Streptomyces bobili TaxID=67280 RepID=UPI0033BF1E4B